MKILYIITKSNWGGAQRHVFDIAVESRKKGYDVVVALGGAGILNDKLVAEGIRTRTIGTLGRDIKVGDDMASFGEISKIVRSEKPDILHLHSPKAAGIGSFAGRIWRVKKIIYTVHGWAFNEDRSYIQKLAIIFFSWLTMLFATDVIVLSHWEENQTRRFPWIVKKIRLIPLGIKAPMFYGQANARDVFERMVKDRGLADPAFPFSKRILVGTIAELHPNKGLAYAIDAIAKVKERFPAILFFIISDGEQRQHLESLIREKGLERQVILAGRMENAAQYLKAFSIFLLSSVKEGLPYTIIEAGYAGIPVVATTVGGIPEIIDDMKTGILIQPKKYLEIAHGLEFLIKHKGTQKEYGRLLHAKVISHFSLDRMMQSTFELYEENKENKIEVTDR